LNIQWVAPKKASLPEGDTSGWGGYSLAFNIFPPGKRWTAQSVAAEVTQNLSAYFTFTGCGQEISVGDRCELETPAGGQPVEVISVSKDGFVLKSLPGHVEGADRIISFKFYHAPSWGAAGSNRIFLGVKAWGPMSKASQLGPLNSLSVARISWSIFTKNLQGKLNDAETDYITADKAVGSAQNRSPERADEATYEPSPDTIYVDPDEVLNEWNPEEIPFVNLEDPTTMEEIPDSVIEKLLSEIPSEAANELEENN
jgi:putative secreted protein